MKTEDIHKLADHWYETSVVPCRREIQQDICAWYKDDDSQFREVATMAFFYGYVQAMEEFEMRDEAVKRINEEILKEIELEKSKMSKWQRFKKWVKNWAYFGGF